MALVVQNDAIYCGEGFKESNFQIFSSRVFWAVILKILVCLYEEVSSSLETIDTHLPQYLEIVRTCSNGQEILQ